MSDIADATDVKVGGTDVQELYVGSTQIWTRTQLWTPDLIGAVVWDPDDIAGSNGDPIGSWASKYGSKTATAAGAARPTLLTGALNGHNAMAADGSDDLMSFPAIAFGAGQILVVAIGKRYNPGTFMPVGGSGYGGAPLRWTSIDAGSASISDVTYVGPDVWQGFIRQGNSGFSSSAYRLLSHQGNGNNGAHVRINGANAPFWSSFTGYSGVSDAYVDRMFGRGGYEWAKMDLAWLGIFVGTITTDIVEKMEGYAAHQKDALDLLNASHPYKTNPPTA